MKTVACLAVLILLSGCAQPDSNEATPDSSSSPTTSAPRYDAWTVVTQQQAPSGHSSSGYPPLMPEGDPAGAWGFRIEGRMDYPAPHGRMWAEGSIDPAAGADWDRPVAYPDSPSNVNEFFQAGVTAGGSVAVNLHDEIHDNGTLTQTTNHRWDVEVAWDGQAWIARVWDQGRGPDMPPNATYRFD